MSFPIVEPCRLAQLAGDAAPEEIAPFLHQWEQAFLSDVQFATEDPKGKLWRAYQIGDDGLGGVLPLMVDYYPGGAHMLSSDASAHFIRLKLVEFDPLPPCDGSCGFDDDWDDDWPMPRGECTCDGVEQGIRLSSKGRAVLGALTRLE